ncbi:hypothetical protein BC343_06640 [Mucilaginibacter pedocola]|uniref:HD domain-containing protein n=2 Tax=Mucilaginibacter pedocola TaxID=1792845 RepID=A0A1S9PGX4_9SPHI|nr:hypothetical protein BC343_06640 [Mucilaginibacter pedocola]
MQFEEATAYILNKLSSELPAHLTYHCLAHTQDVVRSARQIGVAEGIGEYDMKLLLTAAYYHDAGFLKGAAGHEEESCRMAEEALPGFGYSADDIKQVCGMIMATQIPQNPQNLLEQIIADADLDYLGRDDFFTIGNTLFDELAFFGVIKTEDEWNALQVRFLEKHHFFTYTAITSRQQKKEENLELVKQKLP